MGIMLYSLLWVMQDLYHQPYVICFGVDSLHGFAGLYKPYGHEARTTATL